MGSLSFTGRVLFASYFIFSGWKMLRGYFKDPIYKEEFTSKIAGLLRFPEGVGATHSAEKNIVAFFVTFFAGEQILGGFLLLFDNLSGVYTLRRCLLIATPILFDFYNYKVGEPEFLVLLQGFLQNVAFIGVLLIFMETKITIERKQSKRTLGVTQPHKYISEKSMTPHRGTSSPQKSFLPMSNTRTLHPYQLMPSREINLSVDLLSQQIQESSFPTMQSKDHHKQEEFIRHRILDIYG